MRVCKNCNAGYQDNVNVCPRCGNRNLVYRPDNQQQQAPNYYQGGPVYGGKPYSPKDKTTAGLLGIFLGAFGAHKFYLGYSTSAIIMLLVSLLTIVGAPVMGIIGLVEGIMYLSMSDYEFDKTYVRNTKEWF